MNTPSTPEPGELVSATEAAGVIGVSRWTIYSRIADGQLPAYKVGDGPKAAHRVATSDLMALLLPVAPKFYAGN